MKKDHSIPEEGFARFIIDVLVNSAVIILLFFIVKIWIAAPFQVIGNSMVNTLQDGEFIVVSKLEYLFGSPQRGDIVVFHPPQQKDEYYIKRIIGIPGDKVQLQAGLVLLNGQEINENYLRDGLLTCVVSHIRDCANDDKEYIVPEGKYFVLGDNRSGSSDSRAWYSSDNKPDPFVDLDQIQGKTRLVLYPLPEIRLVPATDAFAGISQ
jgi:signal peptidase I